MSTTIKFLTATSLSSSQTNRYANIINMQTTQKKQYKRLVSCAFAALLLLIYAFPASATDYRELTEEEIGAVSQNCSSIKVRLRRVQRDDARNRSYLGSQYEFISSKLMLNLNMRLVKNGFANSDLAEQQASFSSERERFKNDFIGYSQEFDNLLNLDCKKEPIKFYRKLEEVREKRADINASAYRLKETITSHYQSVVDLRSSLSDE